MAFRAGSLRTRLWRFLAGEGFGLGFRRDLNLDGNRERRDEIFGRVLP